MNVEDDILLEVQIQNITPHPMFLEVVSFDPAPGFKATDFNTIEQNKEEQQDNYLEERLTVSFGYPNCLCVDSMWVTLYTILQR